MQQGISLQGMSIDCLNTMKHCAVVDAFYTLESASPQVRQMFQQMAQQHQAMAEDWFRLMHSRGWYSVQDLRPEVKNHLSNFIQSLQANMNIGGSTAPIQTGRHAVGTQYGKQSQYGYQSVAQQSQSQGTGVQQSSQSKQYLT